MISRTLESDMIRVRDHLMTTYNYDPGKYKGFDPFQNMNTKFLARIDWNINPDHKFTLRYNDVVGTSDQQTNATSGPSGLARSSARIGNRSLAFSNAFYGFKNTVRSLTAELNSSFKLDKKTLSNKFLGSYTYIEDARTSDSEIFPFVDIWEGGEQYMSFGYELFTFNNKVKNKTLSIVDNATITLNKHTLTAGISFDHLYFYNSYIREGTSYYRYGSVDDFINGADPIGFGITYGYYGNDAPGAELNFGLGAIYAQDEWKVTPKIKVTYGIRLERPFYLDDLKGNPIIDTLVFADGKSIDVGSWPDAQLLFSPRLGFNWDVLGDRSIQVRGGTGIFTGLLPFVWFTNQPTNAGVIQSPEVAWSPTEPRLAGLEFTPNYKDLLAANPTWFPTEPSSLPRNAALVEVSKDFKLPQIWRSSLAADIELPYNMVFTGEFLYAKDINAIQQLNINEKDPDGVMFGPDNRPFWSYNSNSTLQNEIRRYEPSVANTTVLSNTDEGYQYSITAQLTKNFSNGLSGMFAYTYTEAKDISANPGSTAFSAYSSNTSTNSLNDPGLSYSNFSTPNQLVGYLSYRLEYGGNLATTFTASYRGFSEGRWSYIYSNDLNNDGNSSDLMYVPKDAAEAAAMFVPYTPSGGVEMTAAEQATAFWEYVENNEYLSSRKGDYVERFGDVRPMIHRFDVKILQDIFSNFGSDHKYTLQFSLDLLNVGNMLNPSWGNYTYHSLASYENIRPLTMVGRPTATTAPTFRLNANTVELFEKNTQISKYVNTNSTWGALLGLRFVF